ncbi:RICIN domain-containing protein [Streptomyces sp. BK340]|uniref:RICIN domain-containing protein n=1 Tax=Streptomyces sp. BK340 TaxID=2572903 RepID=UPI0011A021E4|nr:RICIN domain-containing protein [Streptomyces sp. BK340]TVZ98110.1 ricin-type beta-trefoil lectin protein [Streptomyces sp. BK340]
MTQGDRTDSGEGIEDVPDARLTELLRSASATAYPALQELRRRHQPSVLAYARLCTTSESTARRLAAEALTTAARDLARGTEPTVPLRHHLLLLAARSTAFWARDERAAGLDPALLLVLNAGGLPDGPTPSLLPAFQLLSSRLQGLLWYGVLEEEPPERTAAFLGLGPADVVYDTPQALKALAQACLRHRLAASDDPRCADFRRLIEEAVRPDGPRYSADLDAHRAHCPYCAAAIEDLAALRDTPRQALAEGLLPWRGTSYIRNSATTAPAPKPLTTRPDWRPQRRYLLASAALGVALAPLLVFLLTRSDDPHGRPVAATLAPPPVTVSASPSPSPSPSPTPSRTSKSPSPTRTSHRPTTPAAPPPKPTPKPQQAPATHAPNGTYAPIVNNATGWCLDVRAADLRDGWFDNGDDVVTAPCDGTDTQLWRVDAGRQVVQSYADDDFCLDSRGATDRGVGVWTCSSVDGGNGENLRFSVHDDGLIVPDIDRGTAVTATGGYDVGLEPDDGSASKWHAGRPR